MSKEVNFKIGPEREYNKNEDVNILYICNDTNKAFIPEAIKQKDTGWVNCPANTKLQVQSLCKAEPRQIGNIVHIAGMFKYQGIYKGETLFTIPDIIDPPHKSFELDFHQKSNTEQNRGCVIIVKKGSIDIIREHAFADQLINFAFTYMID